MSDEAQPLQGSENQALPGARSLGKASEHERLEVTVFTRSRDDDAFREHIERLATIQSPRHLARAEFAERFGASPDDLAAIRRFADRHGLSVVEEHPARRSIVLAGTVAQFDKAFGIELQHFAHPDGSYRGHLGPLHLPAELHDIVTAVLGLDSRPQAEPRFRARPYLGNTRWYPEATATTAYTPLQLASIYDFPSGDGRGECIALIELGGGYRTRDLEQYFSDLGLTTPTVVAVSVDHGRNHPTGDANGPDGEVMLDIEVAGAVAPAATIVVYFAPNTDAGFLDAVTTAIHDTAHAPSVLSISWGSAEARWSQQAMTAFDQAFQSAAALGVTVCVASGDRGSSDGVSNGANHVDFPASSPHALACGGTRLEAVNGAIASERVWNDGAGNGAGGGGVSAVFPLPQWQADLRADYTDGVKQPLTMRGVPDVAGDADPQTGYRVRVDGNDMVIGGTSAVAPLWAALLVRIDAIKGHPAGLVQPRLYKQPSCFHDIIHGNNGDFAAAAGWDACTGLGSPDGKRIEAAL